jgi:hypothetical protein
MSVRHATENLIYYLCIYVTMKHIQIVLDDKEAKQLEKIKGNKSWKELLMSILEEKR